MISRCILGLSLLVFGCSGRDDVVAEIKVTNGGPWGQWKPMEYCPDGFYADGFKIKVEPDQYSGDDSAMNGIYLSCWNKDQGYTDKGIKSGEGPWGSWSEEFTCKYDEYLASFSLKVEKAYGAFVDDSAANGIKFGCKPFDGSSTNYLPHRGDGPYGTYDDTSHCPAGSVICGLATRVERDRGIGDDSALNDVIFECCSL